MNPNAHPEARKKVVEALRAAVMAWSPRAYEARLVFTAIVTGLLARALHLSGPWAIISAILVLQPDPVATRKHSVNRFVATLLGAAASVGAVSIGLDGTPAFLLALVVTCTLCAAFGLEDGLRPACVCCAVLLIRPEGHVGQPQELRFALDRILAVVGGALVALAVSYLPGWRPEAAAAARGARPPASG